MKVFELDENGNVKNTVGNVMAALEPKKNEDVTLYADVVDLKPEHCECPHSHERGDEVRNERRWCKRKQFWCDGNGNLTCDEPFEVIEKREMCAKSSIFGNDYLQITEENIEDLRAGKVLYLGGEYGIFVKM